MTQHTVEEKNHCPFCKAPIIAPGSSCNGCDPTPFVISPLHKNLTGAFTGLVVFPALSTLFVSLSLWTILFAITGSGAGFLVANYGFSVKQG